MKTFTIDNENKVGSLPATRPKSKTAKVIALLQQRTGASLHNHLATPLWVSSWYVAGAQVYVPDIDIQPVAQACRFLQRHQ